MEVTVDPDDGHITWHIKGPEAQVLVADLMRSGATLTEVERGLDKALNTEVQPLATSGP